MNKNLIDITGQKFGRLTILSHYNFTDEKGYRRSYWICKCDCGNEYHTQSNPLRTGRIKSCGCFNRDRITTHGQTKNKQISRAWQSWRTMKSRCYRITDCSYKNYGGRGISVCNRWKESFENFFADMGECPENHSLDRINVDGDYEPENCRWADSITQANNTRFNTKITHNGITKTITEWSREFGVSWTTIRNRWRKGTLFI